MRNSLPNLRRLLAVAVCSLTPAAALSAQLSEASPAASTSHRPDVAAWIPGDAIVHLQVSGEPCFRAAGQLALAGLAEEPEVQEFLKPMLQMAAGFEPMAWMQLQMATGLGKEDVNWIWNSTATVSFLGMHREERDGGGFTYTINMPKLVMTLSFNEDINHVMDVLSTLEERATEMAGLTFSDVTLAGGHKARYMSEGSDGAYYTIVDQTLIVAPLEELMVDVLNRKKGGNHSDSLAMNSGFQVTRKEVARQNSMLFAYVDIARVFEMILEEEPGDQELQAFAQMFPMGAFGYGADLDGRGIRDRIFMELPDSQMMNALYPEMRTELRSASMLPASTGFFGAGVVSFEGAYDYIMNLMINTQPESQRGYIMEEMRQMEMALGFSPRKDLLPHLGPEFAFFGSFQGRSVIPDVGIAIELKDREHVKGLVQQVLDGIGRELPRNSVDYMGYTVHYADLQHLGLDLEDWMAPKPSWVFLDDFLVITPWPQAAKNLIRSIKQGGPTLAQDNKEYRELLAHVRRENSRSGTLGVSYIDLPAAVEFLLDNGTPLLQSAVPDIPQVPINWAAFPHSSAISKHLFGFLGTSHRTDRGVYMEYYSPTGYMLPMAMLGAGAAVFAMRVEQEMEAEIMRMEAIEAMPKDEEF